MEYTWDQRLSESEAFTDDVQASAQQHQPMQQQQEEEEGGMMMGGEWGGDGGKSLPEGMKQGASSGGWV
jgi:hypothetical protein